MSRSFAEIHAKIAREKVRIQELADSGEEFFEFQANLGPVVVHRSTRRPGYWQMTWFGGDGEPAGHAERKTLLEALKEARWYGAKILSE